jgi:hypothetical protein
MFRTIRFVSLLGAVALFAPRVSAQFSFDVDGRQVQVHSFASQGFLYSNDNNYLTTKSSSGSFAMTDAAVNISMPVTDKFRIGAQMYLNDLGNLGKWHPQLDWAVADYKFKDWFGIRGGKVKTAMGLYNDTQDMDFLHTFALLPQSMYPLDMRSSTIAHTGGDLYGGIPLKRFGSLSYTAYAGQRQDSLYGGYPYLLHTFGISLQDYGGLVVGQDLRWNTPLNGLLVGASHMDEFITGTGQVNPSVALGGPNILLPYGESSNKDQTNQFYGQYVVGNLSLDSEYRRYWRDQQIFSGAYEIKTDVRSWYGAAAYRLSKRLEIGSYYSRFSNNWVSTVPGQVEAPSQSSPDRHLYDKVVSARVDLNSHWNVKVEGHFMDGWGGTMYPDGFYPLDNPQGIKPKTNMLIIRTGVNF